MKKGVKLSICFSLSGYQLKFVFDEFTHTLFANKYGCVTIVPHCFNISISSVKNQM
eukprot:TRINITY_DN3311_c2_g8_i1.p1 TRINITY_DN3311_c2_g8~~TRINITY_DN3311_c2_g8_i1.p1  ORF type:complete len:56 (+),score=7.75 TRINITY_DN3311_c2_g8_i1:55-222(+)